MTSFVFQGITSAPNKYTSMVRNRVGERTFMDGYMQGKKDSHKGLCCTRLSSGAKVRVSIREPVGTPLFKVESKGDAKETAASDGIGIVSFIRGKVFLITGATGFLAKALVEKVLRSIPDVGKIYLLIKAKDQEVAMQRLKSEVISNELFKSLEEIHGKSYLNFILSKLVPVVGNVCETNLGMEVDVSNHIANEVNIIINSAGNTTFDERYDVAIRTNTLGPSRVLGFAKRCKKLELFLHVSTAYVNGERQGRVMEKPFYKGDSIARERAESLGTSKNSFPLLDVQAEVEMAMDAIKDSEDNTIIRKMKEMGLKRAKTYGWQDTYVFTKAMGEILIGNERDDIPVVIIRPSVVESTCREPFPGWIEGFRMLDPVVVLYGKGEITGFPADANGVLDVVPVDMVVNGILAATARHAKTTEPRLSIYQIASSITNPLVYQDLCGYMFDYFVSSPYVDPKTNRAIKVQTLKLYCSIIDYISQVEAEATQMSSNAPPKRMLQILKHLATIYEPYVFYGGRFDNSNTEKLLEEMSQEEKMNFGFDVKSIDWNDYICNIHIPGITKNVLNKRAMK